MSGWCLNQKLSMAKIDIDCELLYIIYMKTIYSFSELINMPRTKDYEVKCIIGVFMIVTFFGLFLKP